MSESCSPVDCSLPGSSAHGILGNTNYFRFFYSHQESYPGASLSLHFISIITTRKKITDEYWLNTDVKPLNKILAIELKKKQTSKGSYTNVKWDLLHVYEDGSVSENQCDIPH